MRRNTKRTKRKINKKERTEGKQNGYEQRENENEIRKKGRLQERKAD